MTIEDELRETFQRYSAGMDRPVRAEEVHARVRRTRRRRAVTVASGIALVIAATAIGVLAENEDSPMPGGGSKPTAAHTAPAPREDLETVGYSVTRASDGSIRITLREVFDAPKLIARLNGLGVKAVPLTRDCPAPDGERDQGAARRAATWLHEQPEVGRIEGSQNVIELRPGRMAPGWTLVFAAMSEHTPGKGSAAATTFTGLRLNAGAQLPACLPL